MWIADKKGKTVHDLSHTQYECHIAKIPKEDRKKIYTKDGVKRFFDDPLNKEYGYCQHCMPEFFEFDMNSLFKQ